MNATLPIQEAQQTAAPRPAHWASHAVFQFLIFAFVFTEVALAMTIQRKAYWLGAVIVLILSHFMHGLIIGFHEASHGFLRKNRRLNEFDGVLAGVLSFMSFSLYRAAHQTHHAYFTTERDEELWPFVMVDAPRWKRRLAAFLELNAGLFYTPVLFMRTFLRKGSPIRSRKVRRRIWVEYALIALVWAAILWSVAHWHVWPYFLWMYLAPAFLAGNLQSWRKYIEHVGLTGPTVNSATRSIVAESWAGRLFSFTLMHEPFHGVHHLHVGLPYPDLPRHASSLTPASDADKPPFPNYRSALVDLVRSLPDPRAGKQWQTISQTPTSGKAPGAMNHCRP